VCVCVCVCVGVYAAELQIRSTERSTGRGGLVFCIGCLVLWVQVERSHLQYLSAPTRVETAGLLLLLLLQEEYLNRSPSKAGTKCEKQRSGEQVSA
jgi:hypothetical protein